MRTEKGEYSKTVRKQQTSSFTLQFPPVSDVISNLEQRASFYRTQDVLHQLRNPLIAQIPVYTQSNEKCYLNKYGDEVIGRAAVTDSVSQFNSSEWQQTDGRTDGRSVSLGLSSKCVNYLLSKIHIILKSYQLKYMCIYCGFFLSLLHLWYFILSLVHRINQSKVLIESHLHRWSTDHKNML